MAKILIVDDEVNLISILKDELEEAGHEVFTAFSGSEVLPLARKKKPDLIILDVAFPDVADMDGFKVCAKLKMDEKTNKIPVLMCTGRNLSGDVEKRSGLNIDGYITKPFDLEKIKGKIINILEKKVAI